MATVDSIVDGLTAAAESALRTAREQASRISNLVPAITDASFNYDYTKPNLPPPPKFSDLFPGTDTTNETVQWLDGLVDDWIDQYFPELSKCLKTLPEEWLCGILSGQKEFGLDKTVFEIVAERARDRAYRASTTEQRTLAAQWSERGFTVPPGALVQISIESEQRASQAIGEVNREQYNREAEIKLDLLKFAEEQAIRLKLGVMSALSDFYRAWISLPDKDIERARIRAQAEEALYRALSAYYNVELGFEELRLQAAQAKAGIAIDNNRVRVSNADGGRNPAIGQAVRGFTDVAASASNAGSALVADVTTGG